jgi:hypothetical protein
MYIRNRNIIQIFILFLLLVRFSVLPIFSQVSKFVSSKGLPIKIIRSNAAGLIHAEILIFFEENTNPAISYLTVENMFNSDIHGSETHLLGILKRLGNDYGVEHRVDYLKIRINFLQNRLSVFTQFINALFSYKSFGLKRYNRSIFNYRKNFMKKSGWEKKLARQYAYSHLFKGYALSRTVIDADSLLKINLAQIRSFYRNTFKPENGYLFLKGHLNPHITFGMIEKTLKSQKKTLPKKRTVETLKTLTGRKIIVLDVASTEAPVVFWFQAIPPLSDNKHMFWRMINNILFDYPTGVAFKKAAQYGIRNIRRIETEVTGHSRISVICNSIKLNYSDIERFIVLVDNEARKLAKRKIERKEYLDSLNFFLGQAKVETSNFTHDIRKEVDRSVWESGKNGGAMTLKIFQRISLDDLNRFVHDLKPSSRNGHILNKHEVIVIAGSARLIKGYFNSLKLNEIHSAF